MAKKNSIAGSPDDPTLPKTPVVVGGTTYYLCFTFGALARAERAINGELERAGSSERVSLLSALPALNMGNMALLFAAGIHQFHPKVGFEQAQDLIGYADVSALMAAIMEGFKAAMPEPEQDRRHPREPEE